jgi:hypothetical protein
MTTRATLTLNCTKTSVSGRIQRAEEANTPPKIDVYIKDKFQKTIELQDAPNATPPIWRFNYQWITPLEKGSIIELRATFNKKLIARLVIGSRDGIHAMYSKKFDYVVFYNPKSACTTIRNLFFLLHEDEINKTQSPESIAELIGNAPTIFPLTNTATPTFKINVVRDPYKRLISGFIDKVASLYYQPRLCTGKEIYRWRFGSSEDQWKNLTFNDFLNYLSENRDVGDIHFQTQPVIAGDVEIVRVESLQQDLLSVYQRRLPALVERASSFFTTPAAKANQSANARLASKVSLSNAHQLTVAELGGLIKANTGFNSADFISSQTLPALNALLKEELEAFGYPTLTLSELDDTINLMNHKNCSPS